MSGVAYTIITMERGVLSLRTVDAKRSPELSLFRPAICLLKAWGGGSLLVPHAPLPAR